MHYSIQFTRVEIKTWRDNNRNLDLTRKNKSRKDDNISILLIDIRKFMHISFFLLGVLNTC